MNERRVPSFVLIVIIIIICILLLIGTSDASRILAESFFRSGVPLGIEETAAEQVWLHCKEETLELTGDFIYTHSDISYSRTTSNIVNKINSEIGLFTKRIIHRAINDLPPQLKYNLLNCLGEATSPPHSYSDKEVGLFQWLVNWRELFSDWFTGTRRFLLRKSHGKHHKHRHSHSHKHKNKHKPKHRPGKHGGTPRRAAAPRPAEAPAPASAFRPGQPVHAPQPYVKKSPPPLPAMRHRQPRSPPPPHKTSKSKSHAKDTNTAIIAASSAAAFALILLLFCCCCCLKRRRNNNGHRNVHRDDRPLLNCCSNLSTGSSQASPSLENMQRQDFNPSTYVNNLPIRKGTSLAEHLAAEPPLGAPGNTNAPLLPLPPGRTAPPHGMIPLPPGKSAPPHGMIPLPPGKSVPPPPNPPPPPASKAPPPPVPKAPAPKAPPPPKAGRPSPPNPPKPGGSLITPLGGEETSDADNQKAKLKPFFWDKVLAKPDHSMVWHDLKAGSFQFNEEMMENLFGYNTVEKNKNDRKKDPAAFEAPQYIQIIDPRKAQNLSILLRALNVTTEEVCDAVMEGNELPAELIQTMLKMAPTTDEELKLRLYSGELSQLGPAELFLKALVDIPFAFKRLESLLFMCTIQEEASTVKESFATLEVACKELKNSRVFLKLLEAVLKTGNRMNDGTYRGGAQAFKLDTLLKLSDVKGIDGKTTLLHFVVLEIIRSEGIRAARRAKENHSNTSVQTEDLLEDSSQESTEYYRSIGLEIVSNLSNELANVKKAAVIDGDMLATTASKLGHSLKKAKDFLNNEMNSVDDKSEFRDTLASFVQQAEGDVIWMLEEEKKITSLVKSTADYFHGTPGKDEGLRLFVIVRDFLVMVDKACLEVKNSTVNPIKVTKKEAANSSLVTEELQRDPSIGASLASGELRRDHWHGSSSSSSSSGEAQQPVSPSSSIQQRLFPAIKDRRKDDSSSDDEG